ncbi:MAG: hypothetical protein H6502_02010 [Candidatus Woesearchaeota archaeon]|nr:MAG: hypothetical protein H6502_02010 [Candidatus Woesearchaeota archaeon]
MLRETFIQLVVGAFFILVLTLATFGAVLKPFVHANDISSEEAAQSFVEQMNNNVNFNAPFGVFELDYVLPTKEKILFSYDNLNREPLALQGCHLVDPNVDYVNCVCGLEKDFSIKAGTCQPIFAADVLAANVVVLQPWNTYFPSSAKIGSSSFDTYANPSFYLSAFSPLSLVVEGIDYTLFTPTESTRNLQSEPLRVFVTYMIVGGNQDFFINYYFMPESYLGLLASSSTTTSVSQLFKRALLERVIADFLQKAPVVPGKNPFHEVIRQAYKNDQTVFLTDLFLLKPELLLDDPSFYSLASAAFEKEFGARQEEFLEVFYLEFYQEYSRFAAKELVFDSTKIRRSAPVLIHFLDTFSSRQLIRSSTDSELIDAHRRLFSDIALHQGFLSSQVFAVNPSDSLLTEFTRACEQLRKQYAATITNLDQAAEDLERERLCTFS